MSIAMSSTAKNVGGNEDLIDGDRFSMIPAH